MSRICAFCGKEPQTGNHIVRHGLAKYKGGIGLQLVDGTPKTVYACAACIKSGRVVKVPVRKRPAAAEA